MEKYQIDRREKQRQDIIKILQQEQARKVAECIANFYKKYPEIINEPDKK